MNLLISGGLGYIGSHTIVELVSQGHNIYIVDNLINSKLSVLDKLKNIIKIKYALLDCDISNRELLEPLFKSQVFDAIFHFAGLKSVKESIDHPLLYYRNNVLSTITLVELAIKYNVSSFIFSSLATVYGDDLSPVSETTELKKATNPYGETKCISERILQDVEKANPWCNVTSLRYFNPVGAHKSGVLGEEPNSTPNNLFLYIVKVAKGDIKQLNIFGNDYDTLDGTGVRDNIHVVDLAKGHLSTLNNIKPRVHIYNLGTGNRFSVLEVLKTFERINKIKVPYRIIGRSSEDLAKVDSDVSKAEKELKWKTQLTLEDMVRDVWNFEKNLK